MSTPDLALILTNSGVGAVVACVITGLSTRALTRRKLELEQKLSTDAIQEARRKLAWDTFMPFVMSAPAALSTLDNIMRKLGWAQWNIAVENCLYARRPTQPPETAQTWTDAYNVITSLAATCESCLAELTTDPLKTHLLQLRRSLRTINLAIESHHVDITEETVLDCAAKVYSIAAIADEISAFLGEEAGAKETAPAWPTRCWKAV